MIYLLVPIAIYLVVGGLLYKAVRSGAIARGVAWPLIRQRFPLHSNACFFIAAWPYIVYWAHAN